MWNPLTGRRKRKVWWVEKFEARIAPAIAVVQTPLEISASIDNGDGALEYKTINQTESPNRSGTVSANFDYTGFISTQRDPGELLEAKATSNATLSVNTAVERPDPDHASGNFRFAWDMTYQLLPLTVTDWISGSYSYINQIPRSGGVFVQGAYAIPYQPVALRFQTDARVRITLQIEASTEDPPSAIFIVASEGAEYGISAQSGAGSTSADLSPGSYTLHLFLIDVAGVHRDDTTTIVDATNQTLYFPPASIEKSGTAEFRWNVQTIDTPDLISDHIGFRAAKLDAENGRMLEEGGIEIGYSVTGPAPITSSDFQLYWAKGETKADILGPAGGRLPIPAGTTDYSSSIFVSATSLGAALPGTTHLLLVVDPDDRLSEFDDTNNVKALRLDEAAILDHAVNVIVSQPDILATFFPARGALTIPQAATILGFDHFNWKQVITDVPAHWSFYQFEPNRLGTAILPGHPPELPGRLLNGEDIVDPVLSSPQKIYGISSLYSERFSIVPTKFKIGAIRFVNETDAFPYYWNEGAEVKEYTSDKGLYFQDAPRFFEEFIRPPEDAVSFRTQLVGVKVDGTSQSWPGYSTNFDWKSNAVHSADYDVDLGGIFAVNYFQTVDTESVPPVASGGILAVGLDGEPWNRRPMLQPVADRSVELLQFITFETQATDSDLDQTLTYSLDAAPPGAAIDQHTGRFQWVPDRTTPLGKYEVVIRVTDNGTPSLSTTQKMTLTVTSSGQPHGGFFRLSDINPGSDSSRLEWQDGGTVASLGANVLFMAYDGVGRELWKTDGTTSGTKLVDFVSLGPNGTLHDFTTVGPNMYFTAGEGPDQSEPLLLYKTDGTSSNTLPVVDLAFQSPYQTGPHNLTAGNGQLFFTSTEFQTDKDVSKIWRTDGTPEGTLVLASFDGSNGPFGHEAPLFDQTLKVVDGILYFVVLDSDRTHSNLWRSDGTVSGTFLVRTLPFWAEESIVSGNLLYLMSRAPSPTQVTSPDPVIVHEWRTDGTSAGTIPLSDLTIDARNFVFADDVRGTLLYVVPTTNVGLQLWRTQGTPETTALVAQLTATNDFFLKGNVVVDGVLYFVLGSQGHLPQLWSSDGTPGSTRLVTDLPGVNDTGLTQLGGSLYFSSGMELWRFEISTGNVVQVADFSFASTDIPVPPTRFTALNGKLFLTVDSKNFGVEPWIYDPNRSAESGDTSLSIAATSANKVEGSSGNTAFNFTITRTGLKTGTSTVSYAVSGSGDHPADAKDFGGTFPAGKVTFKAGESIKTITVNVKGDSTAEPNEQFTMTLSNPSPGATIFATAAIGIIQNDDSNFSIASTDANKDEGDSASTPVTFTVTRSGDVSSTGSVKYVVAGSGASAANAADFGGTIFPSGTLNFAIGETEKTISLDLRGDTTVEANEGFTVKLTNPVNASITTAMAGGTILNDDSSVAIAATSAKTAEGNSGTTPFFFTLTRTGDVRGSCSVDFVVNGAARYGASAEDFESAFVPHGTITFAATESTEMIVIPVKGDAAAESNEDFVVSLSNPSNTILGSASATGTIQNDDSGLSITATNANKAEGNSGNTTMTFTITRSGILSGRASVQFSVSGNGENAADAADFGGAFPTGKVNFAANQAKAILTINIRGDTLVEGNEAFRVTLSNAINATLAMMTADGTIKNDDAVFAIGPDQSAAEGNSGNTPFQFTVTRTGDVSRAANVKFTVSGNGAVVSDTANAADFGGTFPSGTLNFAANETTKLITINVRGDTAIESDEGFKVTLAKANNATLSTSANTALGTIQNDDGLMRAAQDNVEESPSRLVANISQLFSTGLKRLWSGIDTL